jgi:hypothetical protein
MRRILLAVAIAALTVPGLAQAAGQSLPDTLGFVRDKLTAEGLISYAMSVNDSSNNQSWTNQMTAGASNISVETCRIAFHWRTTVDNKTAADEDTGVPFSEVSYVDVTSMEEDTQHNIAAEHPTWALHVTPPIWVVSVVRANGNKNALDFRDHDNAEAVAQAVRHGADLCKH